MRIRGLKVRNLRAIRRIELDLARVDGDARRMTILLGANGSGKTTLLHALAHTIWTASPHRLQMGQPLLQPSDVRSRCQQPASSGTISTNVVLCPSDLGPETDLDPILSKECCGWLETTVGGFEPQPSRQLTFPRIVEFQKFDSLDFEANMRRVMVRPIAPCIFLPADRGMLEDYQDLTLKEVIEFDPLGGCMSSLRGRFRALAAQLAMAATDSEPPRHLSVMWKLLPKYFDGFPALWRAERFSLWFDTGRGCRVPFKSLSEGERALLLMFGELAIRAPVGGIVLIDEIEQHLHPKWQRSVLDALVAFMPDCQFVLTTQSPYVATCAPDDVLKIGDWDHEGE